MNKPLIKSIVSGAFLMAALVSASTASAHEEELYIPAPDSILPNSTFEYTADVVSVQVQTTGTGATVTATPTTDANFLYSIDLVLTCSDDSFPGNEENWFSEATSVSAECPADTTLVFADVAVRLLK